jgi:cation diffusion facilitator family transporter
MTKDTETVEPVHPGAEEGSTAEQKRAVGLSLAIDLATLVPVVSVALLSGSLLLLTDILDYSKSITASLISWYILRRIVQGHTEEYDYGPGKLEVLGGLSAAVLMLAGLAVMAALSIRRLFNPVVLHEGFTLLGVLINIVGLALNCWLWRRNRSLAMRARSPIMEAQWRANRTDALMNTAVISALSLTLLLRDFAWSVYIDPVCSIVFIAVSASAFVSMIRSALGDLLDKTLDEAAQLKIVKRLAENYDGYESFHGVRSRRSGSRVFVDILLGFHPDKTVGEVMDTVGRLRGGVAQDIPGSEVNVVIVSAVKELLAGARRISIQMLPVSATTLDQAVNLIRQTFALTENEAPDLELAESVAPGRHTARLAELGISDPCYWVAYQHGKVVGVTGFYYKHEDRQEAVWGGWTVYEAKARASVSRAKLLMLEKSIIEAHATGRKYFRLYTSTVPVEAQANHLYDRVGLKVYRTEPMEDGHNLILYRQAELGSLYKIFLSKT